MEQMVNLLTLLEDSFDAGGVHPVEVPVDYTDNRRVLIGELATVVCMI